MSERLEPGSPSVAERAELRADCSRCFGLCCVAPAFSQSADFAFDKQAGRPCPNLQSDFACGIHGRLRAAGFPGCTVYDCFGAGQAVSEKLSGGRDWRSAPRSAPRMFQLFARLRQLHELRWYLNEALALEVDPSLRRELAAAHTQLRRFSQEGAAGLLALDLAQLRETVGGLLQHVSRRARAGRARLAVEHQGSDLAGADLRGEEEEAIMKRAWVLQHAPFEGPAKLAGLVQSLGYEVQTRALYRGEPVPRQLDSDALLIVMGGPMGIGDLGDPRYDYLQHEVGLLKSRIAQDAPVLGVCLGAQLLAAAAGASVSPMSSARGERCYEVGWDRVRFHPRSPDDTLFEGLPESTPVLHWHGDMFEIPAGGRRLASSARCLNQAFVLGSRCFGLQFHCEVGAAEVEAFLQADLAFVERANGVEGAEQIRRDTSRHIAGYERVGERLLRNLLGAMTARVAPG